MHGLLIARHRELLFEDYFHGYHRDLPHDTRSTASQQALRERGYGYLWWIVDYPCRDRPSLLATFWPPIRPQDARSRRSEGSAGAGRARICSMLDCIFRPCPRLFALWLAAVAIPAAGQTSSPLQRAEQELRHAVGSWSVTTEFLNEDGSVARTVEGGYEFDWVIEDRVLQGRMEMPAQGLASAILFYLRESSEEIEMVSVGADGRLWVMTGPLGGDTRYTQVFETQSGGEGQLRFTRYNVTDNGFESRMEWSEDGGATWKPGNHQVFARKPGLAMP